MLDLPRIYPKIDQYRKELNIPDHFNDEEVLKLVQFTEDLAREFVMNAKKKLEELTPKIHKKLVKLGYTQEQIDLYENVRTKIKFDMPYKIDVKDSELLKRLSKHHNEIKEAYLKRTKLYETGSIDKQRV